MSLCITTDVFCDNCGVWVHGVTHPTSVQARAARAEARLAGWRRLEGMDLCAACAEDRP